MISQKSARWPGFLVLVVVLVTRSARAYVGPGAGVGGSSGMNVGTIVVIVIVGLLGLCLLCGLIAFAVAASDRLKAWIGTRNESKSADVSES